MEKVTQIDGFVVEEVGAIIKQCLESVIGGDAYDSAKVNTWTAELTESILGSLNKLNKAFKYIVSCVLKEKGSRLHSANSCYWDNDTDGSCTVNWENNTLCCTVSVFALAI